jgi:hypothetical protein
MKIMAISDQHGHLPPVPECDLLIVAGDQCPDVFAGYPARHYPSRQMQWFERTWLPWRYAQPVATCLVTWGNHDYCGQASMNFDHDVDGKVTYVCCDRDITVGGLRVYLTPWSNTFMKWAFMSDPGTLASYYANIPKGLDILVSHSDMAASASTSMSETAQ